MRALAPIEDEKHDGLYVNVLDTKGGRVLEAGSGVWVRPDLRTCSPYAYFGSPNLPEPSPCPVE
jgi:hypothetical protein